MCCESFEGSRQQILRLNVNGMLVSCQSTKINNKFAEWFQRIYGKLKSIKCKRVSVRNFLGITLGIEQELEKIHLLQEEHQQDLIKTFPKEVKGTHLVRWHMNSLKERPVDCCVEIKRERSVLVWQRNFVCSNKQN